MAELGWTKLSEQTTDGGETAVSWTLAQPVADGSDGVAVAYRNGLAAKPEEVAISEDGVRVTYTPGEGAFLPGEKVWGAVVTQDATALPLKTVHAGDTSVTWVLTRKAANLPTGNVTLFLNGVAVTDGVTLGADGMSVTYIPAEAFADDGAAYGWYVSVKDAASPDTARDGIVQAAMDVVRRRLGLTVDEWPDSALYAECSAVLSLLVSQFDVLSDLGALTSGDAYMLGLVVGLTTITRMVSGLMFARSGGAQSIRGKSTAIDFGGGRAIATIREDLTASMKQEAQTFLGQISVLRAQYDDFAAGHHLFRITGPSRNPRGLTFEWWKTLFDNMIYAPYPVAWPLGWDIAP